MSNVTRGALASIPSPPFNGFWVGPLYVHFYGVMYVVGIALAMVIARHRWQAAGGSPELVEALVLWVVGAGIVGARLYFDLTTPKEIPPRW
jgi:prolipoprotein diacylglyceryltransferase